MFGSALGRFTSPDPMLSSGLVESPQTWNRYSYASNNPLKYVDPLGLYKWSASLGGDLTDKQLREELAYLESGCYRDEEQEARIAEINDVLNGRQTFRDALTALESAASDHSLSQDKRDEILRSRNAYGAEGENDGVTVGTGVLAAGVGAQAKPTGYMYDQNGQATKPRIEVTIGSHISGQELIMAVGHEGSHVADRQEAIAVWANTSNYNQARNGSPTIYQTEDRAYHVSAYIAQYQNRENLIYGGHKIWTRGMQNVDQQALNTLLQSHYSVTPTVQGERILP